MGLLGNYFYFVLFPFNYTHNKNLMLCFTVRNIYTAKLKNHKYNLIIAGPCKDIPGKKSIQILRKMLNFQLDIVPKIWYVDTKLHQFPLIC